MAFIGRAFAIDTTQLADPALQARYESLTHELRCMQCQNQSIADSPVGAMEAEVMPVRIGGA